LVVEKNPTEARQAAPKQGVRYVLVFSLAGAAIALAIIFLVYA
jgi:hypothetical protein